MPGNRLKIGPVSSAVHGNTVLRTAHVFDSHSFPRNGKSFFKGVFDGEQGGPPRFFFSRFHMSGRFRDKPISLFVDRLRNPGLLCRDDEQHGCRRVKAQRIAQVFRIVHFNGRPERFLDPPARQVDAENLVQEQMGQEPQENRESLVQSPFDRTGRKQKNEFGRDRGCGNAVKHSPVYGPTLQHRSDPEADEKKHSRPGQGDDFRIQRKFFQLADDQDRCDSCCQVDAFLERTARIAVDVRQHAACRTTPGGDEAGRFRDPVKCAGRSVDDPSCRACGDMLFEIAHGIGRVRKNERIYWKRGENEQVVKSACRTRSPTTFVDVSICVNYSGDRRLCAGTISGVCGIVTGTGPGGYEILLLEKSPIFDKNLSYKNNDDSHFTVSDLPLHFLSMTLFDYIVLAILVCMTIRGGMKGFTAQLASIAGVIVGWIVAARCSGLIAPAVPLDEPWNRYVAMLLLFIGVWIGFWFLSGMITAALKSMQLKEFDRQVGAMLGLLKGLLLAMIVTFFGVSLSETSRSWVLSSKSGHYLTLAIEKTGALIPEDVCRRLHAQIERFRQKVEAEQGGDGQNRVAAAPTAKHSEEEPEKTTWSSRWGALSGFIWGSKDTGGQVDDLNEEKPESDVRKAVGALDKFVAGIDSLKDQFQHDPFPSNDDTQVAGSASPLTPRLRQAVTGYSGGPAIPEERRPVPPTSPTAGGWGPRDMPSDNSTFQPAYGSIAPVPDGRASEVHVFTPITNDPQNATPESVKPFDPLGWAKGLKKN